jgi:hypothetical protein
LSCVRCVQRHFVIDVISDSDDDTDCLELLLRHVDLEQHEHGIFDIDPDTHVSP